MAAASSGSAAFLFPAGVTVPDKRRPPSMTKLSTAPPALTKTWFRLAGHTLHVLLRCGEAVAQQKEHCVGHAAGQAPLAPRRPLAAKWQALVKAGEDTASVCLGLAAEL